MGIVKYPHPRFWYTMKLHREEVWLRAFEAIMKATVPREGYDGDISHGQSNRAGDRADEVLKRWEETFREERDE